MILSRRQVSPRGDLLRQLGCFDDIDVVEAAWHAEEGLPYPHKVADNRLEGHRLRLLLGLVVAVKGLRAILPTQLTAFDGPDHAREEALLRRSEQTRGVTFRPSAEVVRFERIDYDVQQPQDRLQRGRLRQTELLA